MIEIEDIDKLIDWLIDEANDGSGLKSNTIEGAYQDGISYCIDCLKHMKEELIKDGETE